MERVSLGQLATWIGAATPANPELPIDGVSTDTRALRPGTVFFALGGRSHDGARFVAEAFARGARAAVVPTGLTDPALVGRPLLEVDDPRKALLALGRAWREQLGCKVVAITGSAGKTTTKDLLHHLVSGTKSAVKAPASFNNDVGVPLTLLQADRATDIVVLEMGTSGPGEIAALSACGQPDVAIVTIIAPAHLERLGSVEGVEKEKLSITDGLRPGGALLLGGDDARLRAAAERMARSRRLRPGAVSLVGLAAGCGWRGRIAGRAGLTTALDVDAPGKKTLRVTLPIPGEPFARSALLALAAAERLGVPLEVAAERLATFRAPSGRMNVSTLGGVTLVDDAYNANPASVGASIDTLATIAAADERLLVLGGMAELGQDGASHHRAIGARVALHGVRRLVLVGEAAREIGAGARASGLAADRIVEVMKAEDVGAALDGELRPGRTVLFKASRVHRLETAIAAVRVRLAA